MNGTVDVSSLQREHQGAAHMVKRRLRSYFLGCGRKGGRDERKGLHATPAFILGCMASCHSNVTLHSFSPAVFDQFSLLPLPRQPETPPRGLHVASPDGCRCILCPGAHTYMPVTTADEPSVCGSPRLRRHHRTAWRDLTGCSLVRHNLDDKFELHKFHTAVIK